MSPDRLDLLERDVQSHAKTISEFTLTLAGIQRDKAVQEVKDEYLEERLGRIESSVNAVYKLGLWVLATFGAALIALVANFIFKGGLVIGP